MPQLQCPWCRKVGPYYTDRTPVADRVDPHADGSPCICRHVTAKSRRGAIDANGRYWSPEHNDFLCISCGTAPAPTADELRDSRERFEAYWSNR